MAILFPDTAGQATDGSFTHTEGGLTWIWNGSSWRSSGGTLDTYQLPTASTTVLGGVKVDGSTVTIDTNGVISSAGGGGGGGDPQEYLIGTIKTTVVPTLSGFTSVTVTVTESTDQSLAGTDVTVEMLGEYPLAAGLYVTATKVKSYTSGGTATERWLPLDYEVIEVTPPTP